MQLALEYPLFKDTAEKIEKTDFLNLFIVAFCLKQGLPLLTGSLILGAVFLFLAAWALSGRLLRVCAILVIFQAYIVFETWPWTINHRFLELYLAIGLFVLALRRSKGIKVVGELQTSIIILELGVWFVAAMHKIIHGFYLNGEMFLYWNPEIFGWESWWLQIDEMIGWDSGVGRIFRIGMGWGVVLTEIIAGILCLQRKAWSVLMLIGIQLSIAVFSGEWDFGCINLLCLSALDERIFRISWIPILAFCTTCVIFLT